MKRPCNFKCLFCYKYNNVWLELWNCCRRKYIICYDGFACNILQLRGMFITTLTRPYIDVNVLIHFGCLRFLVFDVPRLCHELNHKSCTVRYDVVGNTFKTHPLRMYVILRFFCTLNNLNNSILIVYPNA